MFDLEPLPWKKKEGGELAPRRKRTAKEQLQREKNNLACAKSRLKRKEKFETMERRVAELEAGNRELRERLRLANQRLSEVIKRHPLPPPA